MTLRIADRWIWDFWTVTQGPDVHAFYLQARRALGDAELRHWNATIGHAVSPDLERWEILPDALAPGAPGTFDDLSTWTGSIIAHDGVWQMLYAGTSSVEDGLVQRVGLATSTDLNAWSRHPKPVLEADPRWYELLDRDAWHDQAWRDPWVFRVAGDDAVHAFVTARAFDGDPEGRGVIGHARSHDLVHWETLPPVTEPMGFGQMEVPQIVEAGGPFDMLDVLYTAVGGRDATTPRFTQRIVATTGRVVRADGGLSRLDWTAHREVLGADGVIYERTDAEDGEPGFIKAFRDPFPFRDPADGREWLLFAASKADASSSFNGAVGLARATRDGGYRLEPPLLHADGVNNELERPHVVVHEGGYHLFFSTQRRTFAPGATGPTGLYGFVAPALRGPYAPVNGSGLVLRNPDSAPAQAYSWLVLPDLRVASFVDVQPLAPRHFGGTLAPIHRVWLDGATAGLAG